MKHLKLIESVFSSDKIFFYKHINLRPAIQKKLYFKLLENDESRNQFYRDDNIEVSWRKYMSIVQYGKHQLRKFSYNSFPLLASKDNELFVLLNSKKHEVFINHALKTVDFSTIHYSQIQHLRRPSIRNASSFLRGNHYDLLVFTESLMQWIEEAKPRKIILIEGNKPEDSIVIEICDKLNIPVYIIQHGWSFTPHLGFRDLGNATFFSWGKSFSDELRPFNPKTKFVDVGHPLLLEQNSNEALKRNCISIFLQAPINIIGTDTFDEVIALGIELAESGWKVLFREHPSWPLNNTIRAKILEAKNTQIINPYSVSLDKQLEKTAFGLTIYSSVGYECLVKEVIPVFLPFNIEIDLKPNLETSGLAIVFKSRESCLDYFLSEHEKRADDLKNFRDNLKSELKRYFVETGEKALKKLNSALND
jgi:hypothetical protein